VDVLFWLFSARERRDNDHEHIYGAGQEKGGGVGQGMLLVALSCGRLPGILDISARHPFVVFGTMEGKAFASLTACVVGCTASALLVYFYETG
jgi:hypothetical protein